MREFALRHRQRGFLLNPYRFGGGGSGDPNWGSVAALMPFDDSNGSTSFVDLKGHTVTGYDGAQISTAQSKFGGSSLDLSGTAKINIALGGDGTFAGDFAFECWVYHNNLAAGGSHVLFGPWNAVWLVRFDRSGSDNLIQVFIGGGGPLLSTSGNAAGLASGVWQFYQIVRVGSTVTFAIDGSAVGSFGYSGTLALPNLVVGAQTTGSGAGDTLDGFVDDLRITNGSRPLLLPTSAFPTS